MKVSKRFQQVAALTAVIIGIGGVAAGFAVTAAGASRPSRASIADRVHALRMEKAKLVASIRAHMIQRGALVIGGRTRALPKALTTHFRVFRRASAASPGAYVAVAGQFPGAPADMVAQWGLAVGDATAIPNSAGVDLWLLPGTSGACLEWAIPSEGPANGGAGCSPTSRILDGKFYAFVGLAYGGTMVIGVAPDTNTSVTVGNTNGAAQAVPLSDNVYVTRSTGTINSVTVADASGAVATRAVPTGP